MKKTVLLSLFICSITLSLYSTSAYAGFLSGTFAVPQETGSTCGGQDCGAMINTYFQDVVNVADTGSLIQTGFYLFIFIVFMKFAIVGDKKFKTIQEIVFYMGAIILIGWPIFGGKALPLWICDATNIMTQKIYTSMGGLTAKQAGAGVEFAMANSKAMESAFKQNESALADFKTCYDNRVAKLQQAGQAIPKPSEITFDSGDVVPDPSPTLQSLFGGGTTGITPTTGLPCSQVQSQLETSLASAALTHFTAHVNALQTPTNGGPPIDTSKIATAIQNETALYNSPSGQQSLLDAGVAQSLTRTQLDRGNGSMTAQDALTSFSIRSLLLYKPREMIVMIGMTTMWAFDYYIFIIVSIIKMFAAMGIAFSLLYFIFLQDLSPMVSSVGFWMFGNAMYIVAAVAQNVFYSKININITTAMETVLGMKSNVTDALFSVAFVGIMATTLAGILTWKAVSGINMFFMGHQSGPSGAAQQAAGTVTKDYGPKR